MSAYIYSKVLFVAHARTGSTAVRTLLARHGAQRITGEGIGDHATCAQLRCVGLAGLDNRALPVCTVRNHYEVLLRWRAALRRANPVAPWVMRGARMRDFVPKFVVMMERQYTDRGSLFPSLKDCRMVLRFENLENDVADMLRVVGLHDRWPLERENVTPRDGRLCSMEEAFGDRRDRVMVQKYYGLEMSQLGYTWRQVSDGA